MSSSIVIEGIKFNYHGSLIAKCHFWNSEILYKNYKLSFQFNELTGEFTGYGINLETLEDDCYYPCNINSNPQIIIQNLKHQILLICEKNKKTCLENLKSAEDKVLESFGWEPENLSDQFLWKHNKDYPQKPAFYKYTREQALETIRTGKIT